MELSVVLTLSGLVAALFLGYSQSRSNSTECYATTSAQLRNIKGAVDRYIIKNEKLPLPALRTVGAEDPRYGREVNTASISQLDITTTTPTVTYGALPFQALGLSPEYGADCWGNKYTYLVTTDLTDSVKYTSTTPSYNGAITIMNEAGVVSSTKAAYAILSHGQNSVGAVRANYSDDSPAPNKKWCTYTTTDPIEKVNCTPSLGSIVDGRFNEGKVATNNTFDDVVISSGRPEEVINGSCGTTRGQCAAGIQSGLTNNGCGYADTWDCEGAGPGHTDASGCSAVTPCCISDGNSSAGVPTDCCNGDPDNNGTCGAQCITDGTSSNGKPAACCSGDPNGDGICGTGPASCTDACGVVQPHATSWCAWGVAWPCRPSLTCNNGATITNTCSHGIGCDSIPGPLFCP